MKVITDVSIENEDFAWNHFDEWDVFGGDRYTQEWLRMARGYSKLFHTVFGYYNIPDDRFIQ